MEQQGGTASFGTLDSSLYTGNINYVEVTKQLCQSIFLVRSLVPATFRSPLCCFPPNRLADPDARPDGQRRSGRHQRYLVEPEHLRSRIIIDLRLPRVGHRHRNHPHLGPDDDGSQDLRCHRWKRACLRHGLQRILPVPLHEHTGRESPSCLIGRPDPRAIELTGRPFAYRSLSTTAVFRTPFRTPT